MKSKLAGAKASVSVLVTEKLIDGYADLSDDYNPLHTSDEYCSGTVFGRRIAHGLVCEALISKLVASELPGPGAIFLEASYKFKKPVFVGDTVVAEGEILEYIKDKALFIIGFICTNQEGEIVVESKAIVKQL